MSRVSFCLLGVGALFLATPNGASAYCRTTTAPPRASSCPEDCVYEGVPLYWGIQNPTYVFNEEGFPGLDLSEVRDIIGQSFDTWNDIECRGNPIELVMSPVSCTTALTVGPEEDEPNDNVVVYFPAEEWAKRDLNSSAYALTAIWYDSTSGEILGADMHFNGGMGEFGTCPSPTGCPLGSEIIDLRNVATHEVGHFLGLAHSDVPGSTMWCSADPREIEKRDLVQDDIDGACAIYKYPRDVENFNGCGSKVDGVTREPASSTRCTVAHGRKGAGGLGLLGAGALFFFAHRRRRLRDY